MDSFTLSVMYQSAVCKGGNSAKSQGFEAETLRGRNAGRKLKTVVCTKCEHEMIISLEDFAIGLYTYIINLDNKNISQGKVSIIK